MTKTIIFKELKELQRDARFKVASIILLLLLFIAAFTSFNQHKVTVAQYELSKEKEREMWDNQSDKNPHSAAHDGTYVFKPKNTLSLLDNGINSYVGNAVLLEAHSRNSAQYSAAFDETAFARNNKLSLNFVLLYLFPLVILLIGFNIVSKEKEFDTLRLLKSQGVKPFQLILGKWLSIFSVVAIVTLIIFVLLGISFSIIDSNQSFDWLNLFGVFLTYIFYYAIIITITVLVSCISKTSGISLVSNLAIWVLFCFIMPKIATNIANGLYPYPTKQEFKTAIEKDKDNGFNGHDPNNKKGREFKAQVLKKNGVSKIEDLKFNYTGLIMQKSEEEASKIYAKHYKDLDNIFKKQNASYQSLAFLSPFIPIRLFSMDLTHTGYRSDAEFSTETDKYRLVVQKFLNDDLKDNSKMGEWSYKMTTEQFKKMPKFKFQRSSLATILEWNISNMLILIGWFVISFLLLIRFSKKI